MSLNEREISEVNRYVETGVLRASERLGKMSGMVWGVTSVSVSESTRDKLILKFTQKQPPQTSVVFRSMSDIPMSVVVMFSPESAAQVSRAVARPFKEKIEALAEPERLTLGEVSNILAQSVIGALADKHANSIILSIPRVSEAPQEHNLPEILGRTGVDLFISARAEMFSEDMSAECAILILSDEGAFRRLLTGG